MLDPNRLFGLPSKQNLSAEITYAKKCHSVIKDKACVSRLMHLLISSDTGECACFGKKF